MNQILSLPFGVAWAVLALIVFARTNATYWLGRGIAAGAGRSARVGERLARPGPARRLARAQRILGRMHLRSYLPAAAEDDGAASPRADDAPLPLAGDKVDGAAQRRADQRRSET